MLIRRAVINRAFAAPKITATISAPLHLSGQKVKGENTHTQKNLGHRHLLVLEPNTKRSILPPSVVSSFFVLKFPRAAETTRPRNNAAAPPRPRPGDEEKRERERMGNSIGGKRKGAKVMQLDGTTFRVKPPASAADVLRGHPGFQLLESEEVKLLGARARPLDPDAPLRRGRLYFLVALPRHPASARGTVRRAWSGNLRVGARERLDSLMLTRRSASSLSAPASPLPGAATPVRLKMRLPRAQVEKLMGESKDAAEAAARIMELCAAMGDASAGATPERPPQGILRSPRFAETPEWGAGFMLPPPKTPQRWPTLPRTTKEVRQ
jgi:hypothetical protein